MSSPIIKTHPDSDLGRTQGNTFRVPPISHYVSHVCRLEFSISAFQHMQEPGASNISQLQVDNCWKICEGILIRSNDKYIVGSSWVNMAEHTRNSRSLGTADGGYFFIYFPPVTLMFYLLEERALI